MPALFSRKSKPSMSPTGSTAKAAGRLSAVSSADVGRNDSLSPTPSMADARVLPQVPSKEHVPVLSTTSASSVQSNPSPTPPTLSEFGVPVVDRGASVSDSVTAQPGKTSFLSPGLSNSLARRRSTSPIASSSAVHSSDAAYATVQAESSYAYGYTTKGWDTHLDAARVHALVEACAQQIRIRGLDSPLLFSSMALDVSPINVSALISSYLGLQTSTTPHSFREELQFANPHDLAALIKWACARMVRVLAVPVPVSTHASSNARKTAQGAPKEELVYVQQRGFLDFDVYNAWRETERTQQYPATAFDDFVAALSPELARLVNSLFALLASTVSYSFKNGMVPSRISKHLGALLFGLPEDETFARTYDAFLRASHATEHLLLAYIRAQAALSPLPPRLAEHVDGYPAMLTAEAAFPSTSANLVPVTQIERTVRLYSPDLIQTACETDLAVECSEWSDCLETDPRLGKDPQLSDRFRKLVNLRGGAVQGRNLDHAASNNAGADNVNLHGSLVNKQWDDFLFDGFAAPDASKLAFDLNESVRRNRGAAKRDTVQWSDFTKSGFVAQDDETLSTALSFDDTLKQDVHNWPADRAQLTAKLRAGQKKLPDFHHDVTPRLVASPSLAGVAGGVAETHPISRFDESFADVWADYLVGNGWNSRDELTHRTASFVVVQYKSRPNASTVGSQSDGSSLSAPTRFEVVMRKDESAAQDPRVDAAWFVIQEVVPAQYRSDLEAIGVGKKSRAVNSSSVMRKLTQFRTKREPKQQPSFVVVSRSPPRNGKASTTEDGGQPGAEDVFQPGSGGTTKHIMLSEQNLSAHRRNSATSSSSGGSTARETTEKPVKGSGHFQSRSEGTAPISSAHNNNNNNANNSGGRGGGTSSGATKLISSLRAKSLRVVKSTRRQISSSSMEQRDAAPAPAPSSAPAAATGGSTAPQKGDLSVDRSFTSADYEAGSIVDHDSSARAIRMTAGPYPVPTRTSSAQYSAMDDKDEPWVDVQHKQESSAQHAEDGEDGMPRSSTPPLPPRTTSADHAAEDQPTNTHLAADSSGADRSPPPSPANDSARPPAVSSRAPAPVVAPSPTPVMDPAAAARAALKPRDRSSIPSPPGSSAGGSGNPSRGGGSGQIDTKKLVESLRAGLSPVDAVRAAKESNIPRPISVISTVTLNPARGVASPTSPTLDGAAGSSSPVLGYRDVFAKDPIAGRVADVTSKFGGRGAANPVSIGGKPHAATGAAKGVNKPLPRPDSDSAAEESDGISLDTLAQSGMISPATDAALPQSTSPNDEGWREPYQPGMPLDNVVEETDSVLS